jgi:predicted transposase/invertase (TIGR01784 family)
MHESYYGRGKLEGREEGLAEGESKGKAEGKKEAAQKMLMLGLSVAIITEATGLTEDEVERFK